MATGTIKRMVFDRGFGFIQPAGASDDVFFHTSSVQGAGFDSLREGQQVEFDEGADERNPRRMRATNVRASA